MFNPYKILGVSDNATKDECKKAYKVLAKKYHPDVGGTIEDFRKLNEAYELLKEYDFNNNIILDICGISVKKYGLSHKSLFNFDNIEV